MTETAAVEVIEAISLASTTIKDDTLLRLFFQQSLKKLPRMSCNNKVRVFYGTNTALWGSVSEYYR